MSLKERERLKVLSRVEGGGLKLTEAAEILGVRYRTVLRSLKRYREKGDAGLVHLGRGKPSNRGAPAALKEAILARYDERYPDFGPTLAAEKLALDGWEVGRETLRRWLIAAGRWKPRRKRAKHRSQRERRAHFGEMVQMDGSHHDWFEGRAGKCCLLNMADDATSVRYGIFAEEETTEAAMRALWGWIDRYGIPLSLYVDRKTVYAVDEKSRERAEDEGREALTQFGRACKKLGIRIITANSPQAKGRIERGHRVYQDRLVKELRLRGIDGIGGANRLLDEDFLGDLNERYSVEAAAEADYHRSAEGYDLADIFSIEEERSVTRDWIVRFENRFFQLAPKRKGMSGRGKVTVRRRLDGSLHFVRDGEEMEWTELPARPAPKPKEKKRGGSGTIMEKYIPPPDHPWRRFRISP